MWCWCGMVFLTPVLYCTGACGQHTVVRFRFHVVFTHLACCLLACLSWVKCSCVLLVSCVAPVGATMNAIWERESIPFHSIPSTHPTRKASVRVFWDHRTDRWIDHHTHTVGTCMDPRTDRWILLGYSKYGREGVPYLE